MGYDYSALLAKIEEAFVDTSEFARAMNLSEEALSLKMRGEEDWQQSEISDACRFLRIPDKKINDYFLP